MKTIKRSIKIAMFIALAGFLGCVDQEFDAPPATSLPEGETVTIADLITDYQNVGSYTIKEDKYLTAVVIADESSGSFYKEIYIQDETGGLDVRMESSANNVTIGDQVKIVLKDLAIDEYNGLMQLKNVYPAFDIIVEENNKNIEPAVVTVDELKTFAYTAQLVQLNEMQFIDADLSKVFAKSETTENRTISTCDGKSVILRNSGYSNFADSIIGDVAPGKGSIIAIASRYNGDIQLYIRDLRDIDFNNDRCTEETVDAVETLKEDFNTLENYGDPGLLTGWKNYLKTGDRGWQAKEFNTDVYVQASGYNSGLAEMESWLITPPLDFKSGNRAMAFESSIAYWEHTSGHPGKVLISTDYDGSDITSATWAELTVTLAQEDAGNYTWIKSGEVDLSAYSGIGYIAFAYTGSDTESTTFAIDNFVFDQVGNTGTGGGSGTGSGTYDDPYDIEYARTNQTETEVWVKGYLVGVYETKDENGNDLTEFVAKFEGPYYTTTNVIIADNASETDISNCVIVQLTSGEIRNTTNLSENPTNEDKEVMYMGDLAAYFGEKGLKSTIGYWFEGSGIIPEDPTGFFVEEFKTTLGSFSTYSVTGDQVWEWASFGSGCAKMSGYSGENFANEDWLISPSIDLTGKTGVVLNFTVAVNYLDTWDNLKVYASDDYSGTGDPTSSTWTEITGWNSGLAGNSWDFFPSGDIAMTTYEGKTIYLAFKYVSSASAGSTWEIGDVVLSEN